jgi:hypothetical protein
MTQDQPEASAESIFTRIYESNLWGGRESVSGAGSDLEQTAEIRARLPGLLRRHGVRSMLDIPCGDFHWMRHVDLSGIRYIGADVVQDLVRKNVMLSSENIEFRHLDLVHGTLPKVDLVFCRDCLVHLSYADAWSALENIANSGAEYLLTTTFVEYRANHDIATGEWRPLNLERPPFDLPAPLEILDERCSQHQGRYRDKSLGLWRMGDVAKALAERRARKNIAVFSDGQGWVVDRIVERLAREWMASCNVDLYAYTRTAPAEFARICNAHDVVYYANWDIAHFADVLDQVQAPVVMSVRSFRYPPHVPEVAQAMAGIHVINRDLLHHFPSARVIPDGIPDDYVGRGFVVGFSAQATPGNLDYKGYFLVRQACAELGVAFYPALGDIPAERMPQYYKALDVFVCASENEGFGAPIAECFAMGVPVISTAVGVARELPGVTLVERDVAAIKAAIAARLQARECLQAYAWPNIARQMLDFLLECAAVGQARSGAGLAARDA